MTQRFGRGGKSTREMAEQRRRKGILYGIVGLAAMLIIFFMLMNSDKLGIGLGGLVVLLVVFKVIEVQSEKWMKHQNKLKRRAVRGAKGEENVDELLANLGEDFYVIHDVASPYGNIDHLALSKSQGLFLIETKAHGGKVRLSDGKILVNGKDPEKDFIAQTLKNTYWLRDLIQKEMGINAWINPIIVFTNAFVTPGKPIKGITVTNKKYLSSIIKKDQKNSAISERLWENRDEFVRLLMNDKSTQ